MATESLIMFNILKNGGSIMDWKLYKKAMVVFAVIVSLAFVAMGGVFSPTTIAKGKEIGPNTVQGKVLSVQGYGFGRGTIAVKSDQTGKTYTFYVGHSTSYSPYRYPAVGETIKVIYVNDRGYLKATSVEIVKSLQ
jgi:hypothetical protein